MANIGLLISVNDIKNRGYIDENVDEMNIRSVIYEAQRIHTRDIIGSGLYDELESQRIANTLTALNTTLLGYVKDALIYWTLYEGLEVFQYKIRNKAVMKSNSDNSQPVDLYELKHLSARFKDKAEYFDERLRRYLLQNESSYPLYTSPGTGVDVIHPNHNTYTAGWVFDNDLGEEGFELNQDPCC